MDSADEPAPTGEACIPNIGTVGRERRLKHGVAWLVLGMAATIVCILRQPPVAAFAALYVVFFMAALGYFQASRKT